MWVTSTHFLVSLATERMAAATPRLARFGLGSLARKKHEDVLDRNADCAVADSMQIFDSHDFDQSYLGRDRYGFSD